MRVLEKTGLKLLLLVCAAVFAMAVAMAVPAQAHALTSPKVSNGAHVYTLQANTTYTSYDATGDGKPDTVRVATSTDQYNTGDRITVYINNKKVFSKKTWFYYADIQLIQLKNKKCFLYLHAPMDNDDAEVCGVYQMKKGKLKQVINCNKAFGTKIGYHTGGMVAKVSGNAIWMDMRDMSYMAGSIEATWKYAYKGGTLKRTSKTAKLSVPLAKHNTAKTKKSMTAYKNTACKAKKFTIKKGQKVKFLKVYVKGNTVRFQVKAGGKTGWIKVADNGHSALMHKYEHTPGFYLYEPPFEGLFLAG